MSIGIQTFDGTGRMLFNSLEYNTFIIDRFTLSSNTSRSYTSLKTKVGCQLIFRGSLANSSWNNFLKSNQPTLGYTVSYTSGYPVISFTFTTGSPTTFDVIVFTWGEAF